MTAVQTLAHGTPQMARYEGLGGISGVNAISPPGKCIACVVSKYGQGKSAFFQSHPGAYILNIDGTSTTCPGCPATLYPYVDEKSGMIVGDDGRTLLLSIEKIEEKIAILKKLSVENRPRPDTIVIDSYTLLIPMLQVYITRLGGKTHWKDLHGPAAWDDLYNWLLNTMVSLRHHGYGVIMSVHIVTEEIPIGENKTIQVPALNAAPGFYKRIMGIFEWVGEITRRTISVDVEDPRFPGTKRVVKQERQTAFIRVNAPELEDICKFRVRIPGEVEIPLGRGWAAFEEAYKKASSETPSGPAKE
jgi:hypothetical protein